MNKTNMLSLCVGNYFGTIYNNSKDIFYNIKILNKHYGINIFLSILISLWAYTRKHEENCPMSKYVGYKIYIM